MLGALRKEVGRRAAVGLEDAGETRPAIAAWLEDDPVARDLLEETAKARRLRDRSGEPIDGPRQRRIDRESEVHAALGRLLLEGALVADGLDRVVLPGFGTGTWRAFASLREGGAEALSWDTAVAAEPAVDLGAEAPPFLTDLAPDPRLREAAARLHLLQAHRQDVRNALLVAQFATGVAMDAANAAGVEALEAEAQACARQLEVLDGEIEATWDAGRALARSYSAAP